MSKKNIYNKHKLRNFFYSFLGIIIIIIKGLTNKFFFPYTIKFFQIIFSPKLIIIYLTTIFIILIDFFIYTIFFLINKETVLNHKLINKYYKNKNFYNFNFIFFYYSIYKDNFYPNKIIHLLLIQDPSQKNLISKHFSRYIFFNMFFFFLKKETIFFSNKDSYKWKFNFIIKKKVFFYKKIYIKKNFYCKKSISIKSFEKVLLSNNNLINELENKFLFINSHLLLHKRSHLLLHKRNLTFFNYKKINLKTKFNISKVNFITLNGIKYQGIILKNFIIKNFSFKKVDFVFSNDYFITNNLIASSSTIKLKSINIFGVIRFFIYNIFSYSIFRFFLKSNFKYRFNNINRVDKKIIFSTSAYYNNYFHFIFEIIIPNYYYFIKYKKKLDVVTFIPFPNIEKDLIDVFENKLILVNPNSQNSFSEGICGNFLNKIDNFYPAFSSNKSVITDQLYINKKAVKIFSERIINSLKDKNLSNNKVAYIQRSQNIRVTKNFIDIKKIFSKEIDFYSIEDLAIFNQANIFNSYNKIICPAGSALTNMIFCKPNTKILILLPEYNLTFFHFWQYVADISNVDILYKYGIMDTSFKNIADPLNSNYVVNLKTIRDFIV